MNRLGLLPPSSLDTDQKALYDDFTTYISVRYGDRTDLVTKLSDGRFVGPFGIELHTPEVGQHFLGLAKALAKIPGLSRHGREVAILVVGAHTKAAYEVKAHETLSGFARSDLEEIDRGICPANMTDEGKIVFKVATELFNPGPLPEATWNEAVEVLGIQGVTAVVQYVGFYRYVSTILNGFDAKVPEGQ